MRRWLILTAFGLANFQLLAQNSGRPPALPADSEAETPASVKGPDSFHDSIGRVTIRPIPDVEENEPLCLSASSTCASTMTISWRSPIFGSW